MEPRGDAIPVASPAAAAATAGSQEELVVLVDDDGAPVGTMPKAEVHGRSTPLHLAFSCYAFDADDRLLVTRRASTKRTFAGVWTNTVCGHPAPGEPFADAVRRRLVDELGIAGDDVGEVRLVLPDFRYRARDASGIEEHEICPVHVVRLRGARPAPDPAEVDSWRWVPWTEVVDLAARAPWVLSPWASAQIPLLAARPDLPGRRATR